MSEIISSILSYQINQDSSLVQLLAFFCIDKCPFKEDSSAPSSPNILLYLQHQSVREIKRRLFTLENYSEFLKNLVKELITPEQYRWHCPSAYHELWLNVLLQVITSDSTSPSKPESSSEVNKYFVNAILPGLLSSPDGYLVKSFTLISPMCSNHCLCNSVKCQLKLNQLIINNSDLEDAERHLCLLNQKSTIESYFTQIGNCPESRCILIEFLLLCNQLLQTTKASTEVTNYLKSILDSQNLLLQTLIPYFCISRNFVGPRAVEETSPESEDNDGNNKSIEYRCDCVLIRLYILLYLRILSVQSDHNRQTEIDPKESIKNHIKRIQLSINSGDQNKDTIKWLIEVFITEDSELFDMLRLFVVLFRGSAVGVFLVHRLFGHFLESIYHDVSTLLEMLTTDGSTATKLLQFLLVYLKLPFEDDTSSAEVVDPIKKVFGQLKQKIIRLDGKGLFPYNPQALVRLLDCNFTTTKLSSNKTKKT